MTGLQCRSPPSLRRGASSRVSAIGTLRNAAERRGLAQSRATSTCLNLRPLTVSPMGRDQPAPDRQLSRLDLGKPGSANTLPLLPVRAIAVFGGPPDPETARLRQAGTASRTPAAARTCAMPSPQHPPSTCTPRFTHPRPKSAYASGLMMSTKRQSGITK